MNFSFELKNESSSDWNAQLLKNPLGNIFNTKEYAEYATKYEGWKPIFCRVLDSTGDIRLQVTLFEYSPNVEKMPIFLRGLTRRIRKRIRWNYGPISDSQEAISFFFSNIRSLEKKIYGTTHPFSSLEYEYFNKIQWSTFLINLTEPKNDLYGKLSKHNARKNIERSLERKVVVEEIKNENSLEEYSKLLIHYRKSMNLEGGNSEALFDMWKILKPAGFSGFIAKSEEKPIGGLLISFFNNYINEWGVARSRIDSEEKLYAQDLIKWKIIEWGTENKMKWYDLSGVNPLPKTEKEKGILDYKKKWGGTQMSYWIISN